MSINGRKNPNSPLYTLYINGLAVSNRAYDYVTAVLVFKDRFFEAKRQGKRVSFGTVSRNRKFVV